MENALRLLHELSARSPPAQSPAPPKPRKPALPKKYDQTELLCREDHISLEASISLAIQLDNLLHEHRQDPRFLPYTSTEPVPMGVNSTRRSPAEQRRRIQLGLCRHSSSVDHQLQDCQLKPFQAQSSNSRGGADKATSDTGVRNSPNLFPLKPSLSLLLWTAAQNPTPSQHS